MNEDSTLLDRLRAAARLDNPEAVQEELADVHAEDIADALPRLSPEDGAALLCQLDDLRGAEILAETPTPTTRALVENLPDPMLAAYLDLLPMDDAVDLAEDIGLERFEALLEVIPKEDAQEIRRLLRYPEGSVGRRMTERFFEVVPEATVASILQDIRAASEEKYEMVNDIYVLDGERHLVGVFSLRKALRADPEVPASELMNREVVTVHANDDEVESARRMSRYGYYALPVLDDRGRMVGLLTGDDAQELLTDAETEQVLALGAVTGDAEPYLSLGVWQLVKRRLPWMLALFVAETLTGAVLRFYTGVLQEDTSALASLLVYLPLLIGVGGNAGSQVTTTVTRALALGEVGFRDGFMVMRREFVTALIVGGCLGLVGFGRALLWGSDPTVCLVVGLSIPAIVLWAATVGSVLPLGAKRVGVDPAVMSAPFIATLVDASGLVIFFEIARRLMPGLLG